MLRLFGILSLLILSCCNRADVPIIDAGLPLATTTIKNLRDNIVASTAATIEEDIIVEGYIITSDKEDNFFRSIIVDDGTAAIEVMLGLDALATTYPEGLRVALCLKDCYAAYSYGVLQVGRRAYEYESYAVEYLGSREAVERVVLRGREVVDISPRKMTIAELDREELGRLVELSGLRLSVATSVAEGGCEEPLWRGYATFKDRAGDSIVAYTRDYAAFAEQPIPQRRVTLRGVLQWGAVAGAEESFQLKMRYADDCITE